MTLISKIGATTALVAFGLAAAAAPSAFAQSPVTFNPVQNISGDTNVSTNGTLVSAISTGTGTTNATVNGVLFTAVGAAGNAAITITNGNGFNYGAIAAAPFSALSPAYQTLLQQNNFNASSNQSVILNNLTIGNIYEFQLFVADPRNATGRRQTITDGLGNTSGQLAFNTGGSGGLGQFVTGTFSAIAGSETLSLQPVAATGGVTQINAFQLRNVGVVAVPEPSLVGGFVLGVALLGARGVKARKRRALA